VLITSTVTICSFSCSKRLEQEKLLIVKLEVISPSIKRLEQQKLQMVKLVVIRPSIKRLEQQKLQMVKLVSLVPVFLLEASSPPV
jgi:hypothetical protein